MAVQDAAVSKLALTNLVFAVEPALPVPADCQQADASDQDNAGREGGDGVAGDGTVHLLVWWLKSGESAVGAAVSMCANRLSHCSDCDVFGLTELCMKPLSPPLPLPPSPLPASPLPLPVPLPASPLPLPMPLPASPAMPLPALPASPASPAMPLPDFPMPLPALPISPLYRSPEPPVGWHRAKFGQGGTFSRCFFLATKGPSARTNGKFKARARVGWVGGGGSPDMVNLVDLPNDRRPCLSKARDKNYDVKTSETSGQFGLTGGRNLYKDDRGGAEGGG